LRRIDDATARLGEVIELADRVVLMELGRVTWDGPRSELDVARLTASYLGDGV